jgi:hypothetical protein
VAGCSVKNIKLDKEGNLAEQGEPIKNKEEDKGNESSGTV